MPQPRYQPTQPPPDPAPGPMRSLLERQDRHEESSAHTPAAPTRGTAGGSTPTATNTSNGSGNETAKNARPATPRSCTRPPKPVTGGWRPRSKPHTNLQHGSPTSPAPQARADAHSAAANTNAASSPRGRSIALSPTAATRTIGLRRERGLRGWRTRAEFAAVDDATAQAIATRRTAAHAGSRANPIARP